MRPRLRDCFLRAADDAGLPDDADFRAGLRSYVMWAVDQVVSYSAPGSRVPAGLTVPRWSWDGLHNPATQQAEAME